MARNKKLAPYHQKLLNGDYDTNLRTLPVFTTLPALVLVGVDLHHYVRSTSYLILDAVIISFLGLNIVWALMWNGILRDRQTSVRCWVACIDLLLLVAMMALGDTTLSMRSSSRDCSQTVGECSDKARAIMIVAGILMIITSLPQHILVVVECKRYFRERRLKKCNGNPTEDIEGGPEITFKNDII